MEKPDIRECKAPLKIAMWNFMRDGNEDCQDSDFNTLNRKLLTDETYYEVLGVVRWIDVVGFHLVYLFDLAKASHHKQNLCFAWERRKVSYKIHSTYCVSTKSSLNAVDEISRGTSKATVTKIKYKEDKIGLKLLHPLLVSNGF